MGPGDRAPRRRVPDVPLRFDVRVAHLGHLACHRADRARAIVAAERARLEKAERELAAMEEKERAAAEDYRARLAASDEQVRRLHAVLYP